MKLTSLFFAVALAASGALAQSKKVITLRLDQNKTYYQESKASVLITQTIQGQDIVVSMEVDGRVAMRVRSKTDTSFLMSGKYENLKMKISAMGQEQSFSSAEKSGLSAVFAGLTDKEFDFTMSSSGRVYNVQRLSEIFQTALQIIPDAKVREQAAAQLKQQFGDKVFASSMNVISALLPPRPVAVGENWKVKQQVQSVAESMLESDCVLTAEDANGYDLSVKSVLSSTSGKTAKLNGMDVEYNLSGTTKGTLRIDKKSGWVNHGIMEGSVGGTFVIKPNQQLPEGMTVPMTVKTVTTLYDGVSGPPAVGP
ncbi:DUF6263 family protein [Pedobacter sp. SYP-B3415]|uniref:DUF6263 family protein n=1 Tax=Pedobacter sp. SYP-B3415 TaxID=2496641 RepID=UPI00101C7F27|nr:DUF6263 family protein [Pedobacter sp. SYP-B3415]